MSHCIIPFLVVLAFVNSSFVTASAQDKLPAEQIDFFEQRIRPLFVAHCYKCHSADSKRVRAKLYLDSRDGVRKGGESGAAVVPGQPDKSLLIKAVRYNTDLRMPPNKKLSAAEIGYLETWVKMGAPDPRDGKTPIAKNAPKIDIAVGKKYWAFQPLKSSILPTPNDNAWPLSPIDHYILQKLEAKQLRPVATADKRTLIRRATYDLSGLPPTPDEIQAFWNDDSPDAFAKVIDRLLASPAYGERWGRHWLDVIRYADTAGDNSDYPIPQMVRFRDWVIDAFNADMPYDQFVREELAGDLMPAVSDEDREKKIIATGYIANSRRHGSYEDKRYPWHLTIEDTIDNFGKALLGVTLACARCHDHKFDPFPTEDYYALYGFFSSTRYPWPGIELDRVQRDLVPLASTEEVTKARKDRDRQLAELNAQIKRLQAKKAPAKQINAVKDKRDRLAKAPLPFESVYAVVDGPTPKPKRIGRVGDVRVQLKGDPEHPGKTVRRRFPLVLGGNEVPRDTKGSGRLHLAKWLTSNDNPLFARVMANRIWQYHFGQGIVATPNNFGKQGRSPTHPELLDYLARRFIEGGWSIKAMHRLIILSRVYQLSSDDDDANLKIDVNNEYLWRFSRRRLDAESIRDSLLAISGELDRSRGGPHPFPEQSKWNFTQHRPFKAVYPTNCRSVYLMTQRIQRHPFLALFDGPDTNAATAVRTTTTTPLQALFLMNNSFVHTQAQQFAARLLIEKQNDGERIDRAFWLAFGRGPSDLEISQSENYLKIVSEKLRATGLSSVQTEARAWESFARALFMSNEFVYVN